MEIRQTNDIDFARRVLTDPQVWPWVSDDGCPCPEELNPAQILAPNAIHLVPVVSGQRIGIFSFTPRNFVMFDGHVAILPEWWGPYVVPAAKLSVSWMFDNTPCRRIIGYVDCENENLIRVLEHVSFNRVGILQESVMRGGQLRNQFIYSIGSP